MMYYVLPWEKRRYWSNRLQKYVENDYMPAQVWAHKNVPLKGELVNIYDLVKILKQPHDGKKEHRDVIMTFNSNIFPIKELIGIDKWNGIIKIDLDNSKSPLMMKLSKEEHDKLYEMVDYALQCLVPEHYHYIERSSSWYGWHIFMYFDCEKTEENYNKCAQFCYELFRYRLDDFIKDFSHIFTLPECLKDNGKSQVFDDVYQRPYQKFYMTGNDYKIYNCSGDMDDVVLMEEPKVYKENKEIISSGFFDIKLNNKKEYSLDHNDRFYVITALKKYTKDKKTAYELWYEFAQKIKLYKNYTTKSFIDQFEREYDRARIEEGHITVLKRYGFDINESVVRYKLEPDQYLGHYLNDILNQCVIGINHLIVPTGGGKTYGWIEYYDNLSKDFLNVGNKSILVIEPLNSIINTKYDKTKIELVTGSLTLNESMFNQFNMVVTNYNHLLKKTIDEWTVREDIGKLFEKCDVVVIDESHIMMKDMFRSDVLIEFIETINKFNNKCKIVIQTATPMLEKSIFNIKKTFIVDKDLNKNVKYIFRKCKDNVFNITDIYCLVKYYNINKRKVYIYWNNGSLQNMRLFQKVFDDDVIIYHKRDEGSEDMKIINEEHKVGEANVMISSVYFGVGNDLDDKENAAVIIIGNNVVQEDIQAIGRWRNSKDIEVCQILLPNEIEDFENSKESIDDINDLISHRTNYYRTIFKDKYNRDKSVIVGRKSFMLKKDYYCDYIGKMDAVNIYYKQAKVKIDYLRKLGYDVRENVKDLEINIDLMKQIKDYQNGLKNHRNEIIRKCINGEEIDYKERNENGKIDKICRIINKIRHNGLLDNLKELDKLTYSRLLRYDTYLKYYNKEKYEKSDYAELFSMIWYRNNIKKMKNKDYEISGISLKGEDYCMLCAYLMWEKYRNKGNNNERMMMNYYNEYQKGCLDMSVIEESLLDEIFRKNYFNDEFNEFYKEFFNCKEDVIIKKREIKKENLIEMISSSELDEQRIIKIMNFCLSIIDPNEYKKVKARISGHIGGEIGKKCVITSNFKFLDKYNLKVGQEFDTMQKLANYCNKSYQCIIDWKNKSWIEIL